MEIRGIVWFCANRQMRAAESRRERLSRTVYTESPKQGTEMEQGG